MAPEVLYRVIYGFTKLSNDPVKSKLAASLTIKPAILHDYCRHQVEYADYPGIVPDKGHTVRGTYVTGLTDGDIWRLDCFEGSEYVRQHVTVAVLEPDSQNNLVETREVKAETYVFTAGIDRLKLEEWDYETFRKEKMHRWYDQSEEYDGRVSFLGFCGHMLTWSRGRRSGRKRSRSNWRTGHFELSI